MEQGCFGPAMVVVDLVPPIHLAAIMAAPLTTTETVVTAGDRITRPTEAGKAGLAKPLLTTVIEET